MGSGSGVIWRPDGLIITNAHVALGPAAAVELWDGRVLEAEVTGRDADRDLAALRVEQSDLPAAPIGDSDALRVGQLVVAVGNPLGLAGALTTGIIHAITPNHGPGPRTWVRADVRLAPGNSGGPLADVQGRVIGINSMVAGGLGLAVPSNAVTRFLRNQGQRPRIGVTLQPVLVPFQHGPVPGLMLIDVADGSPAEHAGLMIGDVIIGVAGHPVDGSLDFGDVLQRLAPGERLRLDLVRGGTHITREVPAGLEANGGQQEAA
jgi:serine protease Do